MKPAWSASVAALESVAAQSAKGIGAGAALVVSAPLVSDVQAPRSEELAARVAMLVAGAMGGATRAHPRTATLAQARALASKGTARVVYVQPTIAKGTLRVTLDAYPVTANGWDRVRDPSPAPNAHAFAEAPLDAEVRSYLTSIPLEHASVHKAKHDEGEVLAAACGDLDGDGGMELVLVSRARVAAGHVVAGKFAPVKSAAWKLLAPRAPVPMREPLAGAAIASGLDGAALLVGTTDRGAVRLDASLLPKEALRGIPVVATSTACAAPSPAVGAFEGDLVACAGEAPAGARMAVATPRFDAFASLDLPRPDGVMRTAEVAREPGGKLVVRLGEATRALDGVGAQVALADLDQDGAPEVIGSQAEGEDAVTVWSWDGTNDPRVRLRLPAPAGVRALCTCPPEEGGAPALVAVVESEVWIVR